MRIAMTSLSRGNANVPLFAAVGDGIADTLKAIRECEYKVRCINLQDKSFLGRSFSDWGALETAAMSPDPASRKVVEDMLAKIGKAELPPIENVRRKPRYRNDDGDEVCVDRVLARRDEIWRTTSKSAARGQARLTILANVCAPASRQPSEILWRGAAALSLCTLLEKAGHRVELWACDVGKESIYRAGSYGYQAGDNLAAIRIKKFGQPVDVGGLVTALTPWFFRSAFFATVGLANGSYRWQEVTGMGKARHLCEEDIRAITPEDPSRVVCVDGLWTAEEAITWVKSTLAEAVPRGTVAEPVAV